MALRINVDKNNLEEAHEFLNHIEDVGLKDIVKPYLGKVENIDNCYISSVCLSDPQYSKESMMFQYKSRADINELHPLPINSTFCGADSESAYTIDVDGNLFKCWDDIGQNKKTIGNISHEGDFASSVQADYMLQNPFTNPNCNECKLLPLCLGGCPKKRKSKTINQMYCKGMETLINQYFKLAQETW